MPKAPGESLLVTPLHACLPQQLALLLLGHPLAALLDDGAHDTTLARRFWGLPGMPAHARHPSAGGTRQRFFTRQRPRLPSRPGVLTLRQPGRPARDTPAPSPRVSLQRRTNP